MEEHEEKLWKQAEESRKLEESVPVMPLAHSLQIEINKLLIQRHALTDARLEIISRRLAELEKKVG